jgi:hypothetical protein
MVDFDQPLQVAGRKKTVPLHLECHAPIFEAAQFLSGAAYLVTFGDNGRAQANVEDERGNDEGAEE